MTPLWWERAYPWIGSAAFGLSCWLLAPGSIYERVATVLVAPILTVSAINFGFLITVTTMLISLEKRSIIRELRGAGAYGTLLGYVKVALYSWGLTTAFSGVVALLDTTWLGLPYAVALWGTLLAFGFLTSYRVAHVIFALIQYTEPHSSSSSPKPRRRLASGA